MAANVQQQLFETFRDQPLSKHGNRWDKLWKENFTPWDRGGPSMALYDVLVDHPDLFQPAPGREGKEEEEEEEEKKKKRALVPGCGRGYDVMLLASLGYDAWGIDLSEAANKEAMAYQEKVQAEGDEPFKSLERDGVDKGRVTWLNGDFFADEWTQKAGVDQFDLIFDYTFFCALPISARPAWAKRMAGLLAPEGRLVCLQWPSNKPWSSGGPPWGVREEHYVAQLARPGETVPYDAAGNIPEESMPKEAAPGGLRRLDLVVPKRTHKAGYTEEGVLHDRVAIFAH